MTNIILIKYFSILSQITIKNETFELEHGRTVEELINILVQKDPEIAWYIPYIRVVVNQNYVSMDYIPSDNDEVAFITPVSGG